MEHPLIGPLSALTVEQVQEKLNELSKKLNIAQRMGNGHLCHQLRMALETYQNQYQTLLKKTANQNGEFNFDSKIKIE